MIVPARVAAVRDHQDSLTAVHGVACGREFVDAAERHAGQLPPAQRYVLWRSCDERRRIYDAAARESGQNAERRALWQQLLRRPWWLTRDDYRRKVLAAIGEAGSGRWRSPTRKTAARLERPFSWGEPVWVGGCGGGPPPPPPTPPTPVGAAAVAARRRPYSVCRPPRHPDR